jgi:hypothetical protein
MPDFLRARPALPFAALILLACFLPLVSVSYASVSLVGLPGTVSSLLATARLFAPANAAEIDAARAASIWLYLAYAVPAMAVWLLIAELLAAGGRALRIATGLVGLAAPFVAFYAAGLAAGGDPAPRRGAMRLLARSGHDLADLLVGAGSGWMLLIGASAAQIVVGWALRPIRSPRA